MNFYRTTSGALVAIKTEGNGVIAARVIRKGRKTWYEPFSAGPSEEELVKILNLTKEET